MNQIIVHSEAELELWQAVDYYEARGTGLGLDFEHEVSRAFCDVQDAPKRWPVRRNGARCRLLRRFPYAVYYIELQAVVWIVAVAHMSRKPHYWRNRLK